MPLPRFKKGPNGQGNVVQAVKLNFKSGLLPCILVYDTAFCQKGLFLINFLFSETFHENFIFLAKSCIIEQNARKHTLLKIQFYCLFNITLPIWTFFKAWHWHDLIVVLLLHISTLYPAISPSKKTGIMICLKM